jgi:hypothetical protein
MSKNTYTPPKVWGEDSEQLPERHNMSDFNPI